MLKKPRTIAIIAISLGLVGACSDPITENPTPTLSHVVSDWVAGLVQGRAGDAISG